MLHLATAQNQLVSYFNSYSEVYEGMEDGGISLYESYYFKVNATICLSDIYLDDKNLILHKGDTLVIIRGKHIAYNNSNPRLLEEDGRVKEETKEKELPVKERFKIVRNGRVYYAMVQFPFIWDGTISYQYKKKTFVAKAKEGFDSGNSSYAP